MAGSHDGRVTLSTKLDTSGIQAGAKGIKSALSASSKAVMALGAAAAAAIVTVTKQSVEAYAAYEQLAGGVETLFKGSADKVKAYAESAYKTAGVSANAYMEAVTSFSASLISSLGGNTEKAADVANMAMVDMSDNANKMGTPLANIQNAYQGFAKQNYTMLDNLKLGYGGTKTEMERLLKDAEAISGVKYDINNLSDVYQAIHQIQVKLGVAGTTAKEAESTITGSITMTKSAWENLLTAMSGGGSLDRAIDDFVYSLEKAMENILPVVERSLVGIGYAIERLAPKLVERIAVALIKAIPSLLNAVYKMILGLAQGIYQGIRALFTGGTAEVLEEQAAKIESSVENQEALTEEVKETEKAAKKALAGFDELNVLQSGKDSESNPQPDSFSGLAEAPNVSFVDAVTTAGNETVGVLDTIKEKLNEVVSWVGFDQLIVKIRDAVKGIDFGAIRGNFETIFSSLTPIAQSVFDGVGTISRSFSDQVGTVLGGTALIAGKEIEIASGGVSRFLEDQSGTISQWVTETASKLATGFDNLSYSADTIFSSFWNVLDVNQETIENSIANLLTSFSTMGMTVGTIFTDMWLGVTEGFSEWVSEYQPLVEEFFSGIFELVTSFSNMVSGVIGDLFGSLLEWWNTDGVGIWNGIVECVGDIMAWVTELWNNILQPIIQNLINEGKRMWDEHLKPLWDNILSFITSVWDFCKMLWDGLLKPVVDWLINCFAAPLKNIINNIVNWVMDFVGIIVDVVSGVIRALGGILDFITGIFTGNWEKAWEGIKNFFGGIWDAIWGVIKGFINMIIDGINMLWSGLYGSLRVVINGVGGIIGGIGDLFGQNWGWEIPANPPMIPRLAQGAVIPPNREFMAILGDQRHGTNIEAPLDTIKQALAEVMATQGAGDVNITFTGDLAQLARVLKPVIDRENRRVGGSLIKGGAL